MVALQWSKHKKNIARTDIHVEIVYFPTMCIINAWKARGHRSCTIMFSIPSTNIRAQFRNAGLVIYSQDDMLKSANFLETGASKVKSGSYNDASCTDTMVHLLRQYLSYWQNAVNSPSTVVTFDGLYMVLILQLACNMLLNRLLIERGSIRYEDFNVHIMNYID